MRVNQGFTGNLLDSKGARVTSIGSPPSGEPLRAGRGEVDRGILASYRECIREQVYLVLGCMGYGYTGGC